MKILHVTEDFSPTGGGVTSAIAELTSHLGKSGLPQEILSTGADCSPPPNGVSLHHLPIKSWAKTWCYPQDFEDIFGRLPKEGLIVHMHGIWMAPQYFAAKRSVKEGIPCVLSPHNMLGAWFWRDGLLRQIKKTVYWNLISKPVFRHINAVHALTTLEQEVLFRYFPGKPIEVIPNGINLGLLDQSLIAAKKAERVSPFDKYILILGRLHPVKGIDLFLRAYERIPPHLRIPVIIAGAPSGESYLQHLQKLVSENGLVEKVSFAGVVSGVEKWNLLQKAWIVCAPSYSEGMSMVALEAMASSVPMVTTFAAGIPNIPEGGGLLIHPEIGDLQRAVLQALSWSDVERKSRGEAARNLVETCYDWDVLSPKFHLFYRSLN